MDGPGDGSPCHCCLVAGLIGLAAVNHLKLTPLASVALLGQLDPAM